MTQQQLITLLKRFMDGTTSLDEEAQLDRFFAQATDSDRPKETSADDWKAYCEMFQTFAREASKSETHRTRRIGLRWMAAAAAVALMIAGGSWLCFQTPNEGPATAEVIDATEEDDPQTTATPAANDSCQVDVERLHTLPAKAQPASSKRNKKRVHRLHSMPPTPREYLAEAPATPVAADEKQPLDIEEAVEHADRLLQAMQVQQFIDMTQMQAQYLQAMDMTSTDDEEIIEQ